MLIYLFDDKKDTFLPLTHNRIIGDLRCGILKLRQRLEGYFQCHNTHYIMAENLSSLYKERHKDWIINETKEEEIIFVNSRFKISEDNISIITNLSANTYLQNKEDIIVAKFVCKNEKFTYQKLLNKTKKLQVIESSESYLWEYSWDLINANKSLIVSDYEKFFYEKDTTFETEPGVTVLNPYNVWIGENALLSPGVIIDASDGPVIIDEGAKIMHNAVIIGPAFIGKSTVIKVGAKIYEGTTIGATCKIGGEVEESIISSYSNKQHDGFLGHSYLGEWVNLGADTNNSDLKNNYGNVKMYSYPQNSSIDSESKFLGCLIGDHSKTGINVSINTGTVIGFGCNIYGKELIKGFIPDFSWGEADNLLPYKIDKFLQTAEIVKARRNLTLSQNERTLFKEIKPKI